MLLDTSLLYFYEVAQCGSVRRAAERLHVSASAISRMLSKVEHHFQTELFERQARGMALTATGRVLVDELSGTITHLRDAQARIDELKGLRRGEVSLHCIEGLVTEVIPRFLADFTHRYPDVTLAVNVGGSDGIVEALAGDKTDIGVTYNMRRRADIEVMASVRQPLCVLVAPAHPLARRRRLSLREIVKHPIAISNTSFGTRSILDRAIKTLRLASAPVVLTSNSLAANYGMTCFGNTITLSIPLAARLAVSTGQLIAIPIAEESLVAGTVAVCKRRGRRLSAAAQELLGGFSRYLMELSPKL